MILAISASFRPSACSFSIALTFASAAATCSAVGSGIGGTTKWNVPSYVPPI